MLRTVVKRLSKQIIRLLNAAAQSIHVPKRRIPYARARLGQSGQKTDADLVANTPDGLAATANRAT